MRSKLKSVDKVPFYIKIIFFSLITVLTLTVLFPVRRTINKQILKQKKQVIELIEMKIDHKLSYDSISPSLLHAFEIRGLKVSSFDDPDDFLFDIEKVRLRFNIFRYTPSNPLNAFIGLTIVNSDFIYEPGKNEAIVKIFNTAGSGDPAKTREGYTLPDIFTIKGKNLSVTFKNEDLELKLSNLFFTLGTSNQGDLTISAKTDTDFSLFGLPAPSPVADLDVNTRMNFTGRLSPDLSWADIDIDARSFNSNVFSINRIKWNLKYKSPGDFILTKTGDNIPADMTLSANIPDNNLKIELRAQDFIFNEYFEESEVLEKYHLVLQSVISGSAEAEFRFNTADFLYDCDLLIEDISGLTETPFDAAVDFSGINNEITVDDSLITSSSGNLAYSGTIKLADNLPELNGNLRVINLVFANYKLGAVLSINTDSEGNYTIDAESADINDLFLRQISAEIYPYGDSLDFKLSAGVLNDDGSLDFINSEGNIQTGTDYFVQAAVNTKDLPVDPVLSLLPVDFSLPAGIGNLRLTTSFFLSGNLEEMAFASPLILLEDRTSSEKSLGFAVSGNNSGFRISSIALDWMGNSLTGKISADLSAENDLIMNSQFIYNNISFEPSGVFDKDGNLSLTGDYGLKFSLIKNFSEGYNISLKIDSFPFLINSEEPSYFSIETMAVYSSTVNWKLLVNDCVLERLPISSGSGKLETALLLTPAGGSIFKLSYSDIFSELSGQGSLLIDELSGTPRGRLQIAAGNSIEGEFYNLRLILGENFADGGLSFTNLPVSRFSETLPLEGTLNGEVLLSGTLSDPELGINLGSNQIIFNYEPLNFNAELSYRDYNLNIDSIAGNNGDISFEGIEGSLNLRDGSHLLSGSAMYDSSLLKVKSDFEVEAETTGISSVSAIRSVFSEDFTAGFRHTALSVNDEAAEVWGLSIKKQDSIITADGGPSNSLKGSLYEDGFFSLSAADPFPFTFTASGTFDSGTVNAEITDIKYVFDNLDIPFFYIYEGSVTGGLRVRGNINDPDLFGQINLNNAVFKPPYVEDITEKFNTSFFFREKSLTMPATRVPTNNGMAVVTIDAVMDRWLPRNYDLEIKVPEGQALKAMYNRAPYFTNAFAEGEIRIYGDFSTMKIDGDLKILEGVIVMNNSAKREARSEFALQIITDFSFRTGENNQFYWPSREVPIVKAFLSADKVLSMHYDSGLSEFSLDGELELKGGEIFYFERNFYIKEGGLEFTSTGSGSIDPFLSTKAEIRDVNSAGELTRIYLIVDRSPLSNFAPRFDSTPSLSTAEILSILGGNFTDSLSSSGSFDVTDALLTSVDLFTEFAIFQGIEEGLKDVTGLDLLSIRSSFLSNIVEDKFIGVTGSSSITSFVKYLDNTTLFLGKYVTDDIFLQGLFQFDLYNNSGYSEGLNIDSEIKLEWESPVANIELNFYPDFYDPVEGLNRTSVGLSWRFSY